MYNIVINNAKCIKCKKCVEECPIVLTFQDDSVKITNPELCVSCGHCAAICPENAIESSPNNNRQPFKVEKIPENIQPDKLLFHTKRSIRNFKQEKIQKSQIEELIKYAEKAPSSHNLRNRKYIVITEEKEIEEIKVKIIKTYEGIIAQLNPFTLWLISIFNKNAYNELSELVLSFKHLVNEYKIGNDKIFNNSKCIICIAAPTGSTHSKDDCVASQHYMMLYGKTIGIDSFIVGYAQYDHKTLEKYFKLEKGFSIFSVSAFGFGKYKYPKEIFYKNPEIKWY